MGEAWFELVSSSLAAVGVLLFLRLMLGVSLNWAAWVLLGGCCGLAGIF